MRSMVNVLRRNDWPAWILDIMLDISDASGYRYIIFANVGVSLVVPLVFGNFQNSHEIHNSVSIDLY